MAWRFPPEWHPQDWLWIGFPHDPAEWPDSLERAQEQIAAFASAVAESGQEVRLLEPRCRSRVLIAIGPSFQKSHHILLHTVFIGAQAGCQTGIVFSTGCVYQLIKIGICLRGSIFFLILHAGCKKPGEQGRQIKCFHSQ